MVFYYDTATGRRLHEYMAFDYTGYRFLLFVFTLPILFRRSQHLVDCGFCDDFPDVTVIRPGGPLLPGVKVSETPIAPPGEKLRLSTDPEFMSKGWAPLPKFREAW